MRRATLDLLRCPRCGGASLIPQAPDAGPAIVFGPVQCLGCQARYPVGEGLVDLEGERARVPLLQRGFEVELLVRAYESALRPAMGALTGRGRLLLESEYLLYRSLLGKPSGPVLDVGCGTGLLARRLAREKDFGQVVGLDPSKPMIEEAIAQAREHGVPLDFVRASVPPLPFRDASLGGVLATAVFHFIADLPGLLREICRTLAPGGHLVASTWLTPFPAAPLQRALGLYPRELPELKQACEAAGLVAFERVRAPTMLIFKAERP